MRHGRYSSRIRESEMAIVADVRALTDRLEQAHDERSQEIAAGRAAIVEKLELLGRERLREDASLRQALGEDVAMRSRAVATLLAGFGRELAATAQRQRTLLEAQTAHNRAQVHGLLDGLHGQRTETARIWSSYARRRAGVARGRSR
jgi:hypothetical protein